MTFPVLIVRGLSKTYGSTTALNNVSLTIHTGESVAVMGPSGSGKTTLLHCLSGILQPQHGDISFVTSQRSVRVDQLKDADRAQLRRQAFGFVFQQGLLLPELTALENVALPLLLNGVSRNQSYDQARQWLAALGLQGMEDRRIGQVSGGQAQRIAIARSQITGATVTFADEPTGALDQATSAEVLHGLLQATVGRGQTLVMVTHDEKVAAQCSRIVRFLDGSIVSDTAAAGQTAIHQSDQSNESGSDHDLPLANRERFDQIQQDVA